MVVEEAVFGARVIHLLAEIGDQRHPEEGQRPEEHERRAGEEFPGVEIVLEAGQQRRGDPAEEQAPPRSVRNNCSGNCASNVIQPMNTGLSENFHPALSRNTRVPRKVMRFREGTA